MWALEKLSSLVFSPPTEENHRNTKWMNEGQDPTSSLVPYQTGKQRAEQKLKGYFSLAKAEIDKALHTEENGLTGEAIQHHKAAQLVLAEGLSVCRSLPAGHVSETTNMYKEKMLKWRDEVNQRLQVLANREKRASVGKALPAPNPRVAKPARGSLIRSSSGSGSTSPTGANSSSDNEALLPKGVDSRLAAVIENEILDRSPAVNWDSIAGLDKAKQTLMEMVTLPIRRSDLFTGLRKPARGLVLFGPPGNGKTLLAKAVASESSATFFCISASSLTSKWVGEGEKLMRALFGVAKVRQPSVIFIDEIDSIMSARSSNEHEASRRLKSEFLIQFDGVMSNDEDRVVIMGATNRPEEIDDAVRRRLVKRIYVPLPSFGTRKELLSKLLRGTAYSLPQADIERIAHATDGYSGSDLHALCQEAAMMPIRELGSHVNTVKADQVRSLKYIDFQEAMRSIRPSISKDQLQHFELWNQSFGSN
ncbi:hypothetical protein GOP47_0001141 [Adiantum capillus-veneris]|uniref:microtubule-severing ATPase n=1 Tax=Adiantum capillus-veneris TaxID=13818 RepID=A0A9D4VGH5_ADICA|nr:hypothetical protein GOP47_0000375 [Adiantum capillus-veneris]KAI5084972.1 hypothetical protein GOP47_0001141 [Adiantum capillus-veneris]